MRPTYEYVLARQAYEAAKETESARYAPGFYHRAEEAYRRGVSRYDERNYDEAVIEFKAARDYSEKAENSTRIQRKKAGDEAL